jgi:hypothetical protein
VSTRRDSCPSKGTIRIGNRSGIPSENPVGFGGDLSKDQSRGECCSLITSRDGASARWQWSTS